MVQILLGKILLSQVQKRLGLTVRSGNLQPLPFQPAFQSRDLQLEWKNRITLLSGNLKIGYNVVPFVVRNHIRIRVTGKNIRAKLSGSWAKMEGVEDIVIDSLDADVEVAPQGLGEIYFVHAQSPTFQFHIRKSET